MGRLWRTPSPLCVDSHTIAESDVSYEEVVTIQPIDHLIDPTRFAAGWTPEGRAWIADLPALVETLCRRWGLERDAGPLRHGYNAVVLPVRRSSERFVLKVNWPPAGIAEEARGLEAWKGNGMVLVHATDLDAGALLLERLDVHRTLLNLPAVEAAGVAGRLLRHLTIPAPPGFRDARTLVAGTARSLRGHQARADCPVPLHWLQSAIEAADYLASHASTDLLIHADLHYDNILAGTREPWLAIDPRPVAGEPEGAVPELIWTRHDVEGAEGIRVLLHTLVESAGLDLERTRQWVLVRCVDYWIWGLDHDLTDDPIRCGRVLDALFGDTNSGVRCDV